jgi:hypothetical protein
MRRLPKLSHLLPLLVIAACARPSPESHADAAARAACNQHADAVYDMRNPGAAFRQDTYVSSTRDAPFAGAPATGGPSAGLSDLYERQTLVADCLRGNTGTAPPAPAPASAQP